MQQYASDQIAGIKAYVLEICPFLSSAHAVEELIEAMVSLFLSSWSQQLPFCIYLSLLITHCIDTVISQMDQNILPRGHQAYFCIWSCRFTISNPTRYFRAALLDDCTFLWGQRTACTSTNTTSNDRCGKQGNKTHWLGSCCTRISQALWVTPVSVNHRPTI